MSDQNTPDQFSALQAKLETSRQATGQRIAEMPSTIAKYDPATDTTISGLRANQATKIKELFAHDTNLAQSYYTPAAEPGATTGNVPQDPQRISNPIFGIRQSSMQTQATAGELADIITQINTRKDSLATERDKALTMLNSIIAAGKDEQSSLKDQLQLYIDERDKKASNAVAILKETGGDITPELANLLGNPSLAGKHFQSPSEKYSSSGAGRDESQTLSQVRNDVVSGAKFSDLLVKYSLQIAKGTVSIAQLEQEYNQGPMAAKWGKAKETEQEKMDLITGAKKGATPLSSAQKTQVSLWNSADTLYSNILNKFNAVKGKVGPAQGREQGLLIPLGLGDKKVSELNLALGPFKTQLMNAMIGSQMSKPEIDMVMQWMPTINDPTELIGQKLDNLKTFIQARKSGATGDTTNSNEWR